MESRELFLTSYHFFREVMCSKEFSVDQKRKYYCNLVQDYVRCEITDNDVIIMSALTAEFDRRLALEEMLKLGIIFDAKRRGETVIEVTLGIIILTVFLVCVGLMCSI